MMLNAGLATIRRGTNTASSGGMPSYTYTDFFVSYYGEKTVGYGRYFTAKEHDMQIDTLIQIQRNGGIKTSDICTLISFYDDGLSGDYRIVQIQQVVDQDGQNMTDLALERMVNIDPIGIPNQAGNA